MFRVFYLFYVSVTIINCAPTEKPVLFYDAIVAKCPAIANSQDFVDMPLFDKCNDFEKINKVQTLTNDTKKDVLCLLYFTSLTQYCSHNRQLKTAVSSTNDVEINTICDNLDIIPKQVEPDANLRKIITKDQCKKLCSDEFEFVKPICARVYYYNQQVAGETARNHLISVAQNNKDKNDHVLPTSTEKKQTAPSTEKQGIPEPPIQKQNPQSPSKTHGTSGEAVDFKKPDEVDNDNIQQKPAVPPPQPQAEIPQIQEKPKVSPVQPESKKVLPQVNAQASENEHVDGTNNAAENPVVNSVNDNDNKVDKVATHEENDEVQNKPKAAPVSPKADETNNVDNINTQLDKNSDKYPKTNNVDNTNTQLDKNSDTFREVAPDEFLPSDGENDRLGSEEDLEEPPNPGNEKPGKTMQLDQSEAVSYTTEMDGDSYFFTYFMLLCIIFIVGYVCYHNKQKILALILEGRRGKRQYRGRRPNSANYHKLDSNLEEAITSSCNKNTNNVIY